MPSKRMEIDGADINEIEEALSEIGYDAVVVGERSPSTHVSDSAGATALVTIHIEERDPDA